jgi:transcriptional regulator with XRE-family HTH domain
MSDDVLLIFGRRVQRLREEARLTQQELARRARVSPSLISRVEGESQYGISLDAARKIARALRVSLDYLADTFGGETIPSEVVLGAGLA